MRRDPLGFLSELAAYGDVACAGIGRQRLYLVSDPELVREVLVTQGRSFMKGRALQEAKRLLGEGLLTSEGERHLNQRRLIQPLFHQDRIDGFGAVMVEEAGRTAGRWSEGGEIDVAREMTRLTLAVVGKTLFGADVEADAEEVGRALDEAMEMFDRFFLPFSAVLDRLPLPRTRRFRAARASLDAIIERMIEDRRSDPSAHTDLLSMLLAARDEDGGEMSASQVRDEAMTIFLAGHETTAQVLTWAWYLLGENPDIEAMLHEELDAVLSGRAPAVGDLVRLRYTRAVLAETMRLYPPAWVVGRRALQDVELGGYMIPAGSIVALSQWVVHRDARWFPEPERCDPQRWLVEHAERPRFAYFPFGGGQRLCIGERFAWMDAMLLLATLASRWRLRLVPGRPVEPLPRITLRPAHGLWMIPQARDSAVASRL
jgi:cytochrome P450